MKTMKKSYKIIIICAIVIILIGVGIWIYSSQPKSTSDNKTTANSDVGEGLVLINHINYLCKDDKTVEAYFYQGPEVSSLPGEPPVATGKAKIILSDGRNLVLNQSIAADGVRYTNEDESFIFWTKGPTALVLENNEQKNYQDCMALSKESQDLPNTYLDAQKGFSVRYPADYSVDMNYKYQGLGQDKQIEGVKFTIPQGMANGTNLSSSDTGVSIEIIPTVENCNAGMFFGSDVKTQLKTDGDREYSFASLNEGAAGNFYEEQVWAFSGMNYCVGVRYLIHSTNIENYPEGSVSQFDKNALLEQFDKIRRSLVVL